MPHTYAIKEIFYTLQGEGLRTGCPSVFVRFAGCNLWSGRPEDREKGKGACAMWCDTDFVGGTKMTAYQIVERVMELWPHTDDGAPIGVPYIVFSGGEPFLQLDMELVDACEAVGIHLCVETNGSVAPKDPALPSHMHVTLSPKLGAPIVLSSFVQEVKVILPGHTDPSQGWTPDQLQDLARRFPLASLYLQPQDPPILGRTERSYLRNGRLTPIDNQELLAWMASQEPYFAALNLCIKTTLSNPRWRLSIQSHKYINLP